MPAALLLWSCPPARAESMAEGGDETKPAPVVALLKNDNALKDWLKQRNHDVLAADARVNQARADLGTASLLAPNPQVDLTLGGLQIGPQNSQLTVPATPPPILNFGNTANYGIGFTQTIELGKRGPRMGAARLRLEGAGKTYLDTLGDRVAGARSALARVVYLKARMNLLEDNLAGATRVVELERARFEHGAISGNDFDRLLLDTISLETDIARSRSDLAGALALCAAALRAGCEIPSGNIQDVDAAAPLPAGLGARLGGIENRPDIQAARLEGAAAEHDAILAGRKAIPDPSIRIGFVHDTYLAGGAQPNALQITVTVPLPIFDHGQHDAAKARAHVAEQRHIVEGMMNGARGDYRGLLDRKVFLEATLKTLDGTAVPKSTTVLATTSKAFDSGQVSMTDLLLARRTHLALVLTQLDLHFEHFGVRNGLRHTLGLDTPTP